MNNIYPSVPSTSTGWEKVQQDQKDDYDYTKCTKTNIHDLQLKIFSNLDEKIASTQDVKEKRYLIHVKNKSYLRCIMAAIPILGTMTVFLIDKVGSLLYNALGTGIEKYAGTYNRKEDEFRQKTQGLVESIDEYSTPEEVCSVIQKLSSVDGVTGHNVARAVWYATNENVKKDESVLDALEKGYGFSDSRTSFTKEIFEARMAAANGDTKKEDQIFRAYAKRQWKDGFTWKWIYKNYQQNLSGGWMLLNLFMEKEPRAGRFRKILEEEEKALVTKREEEILTNAVNDSDEDLKPKLGRIGIQKSPQHDGPSVPTFKPYPFSQDFWKKMIVEKPSQWENCIGSITDKTVIIDFIKNNQTLWNKIPEHLPMSLKQDDDIIDALYEARVKVKPMKIT